MCRMIRVGGTDLKQKARIPQEPMSVVVSAIAFACSAIFTARMVSFNATGIIVEKTQVVPFSSMGCAALS